MLRIRLVAVGRDRNDELSAIYPDVAQLTWSEMLTFMWHRLHRYRHQKTQVDQWDAQGRRVKDLADRSREVEQFIKDALLIMGVQDGSPGV